MQRAAETQAREDKEHDLTFRLKVIIQKSGEQAVTCKPRTDHEAAIYAKLFY